MPQPFRQPSQPGASAATKKAFKPPARAGPGGASSSLSPSTPTTAQKPAAIGAAKGAASAGPSRPAAHPVKQRGFQSAAAAAAAAAAQIDQEDLEALVISSGDEDEDDDDEDDDFSAALHAAASKRAIAPTKPPEPVRKRQKATTTTTTAAAAAEAAPPPPPPPALRLPSLSPMSDDSAFPGLASPPAVQNNSNQNTAAPPAIGGPKDDIPLLPTNLITRLLHESYIDKTTKTTTDATALTARYLDVFVREAVARATEVVKERQMVKDATRDGDGDGDGERDVWLDVQDLEEVAPGIVLDF